MRKLLIIFVLKFAGMACLFGASDTTAFGRFERGYEKCQYVVEAMVLSDGGIDSIIDDVSYRMYRVLVLTSAIRVQLNDIPPIVNREDTLSVMVHSTVSGFHRNDSLLGSKESFVFLLLRQGNPGQQRNYFVLTDDETAVVPRRSGNYLNYVYANHFYIGSDPSHITILPDTFRITKEEARTIAIKKAGRFYCERAKWEVSVLPYEFNYTWRISSVRTSNSGRIYKRSGNGIKKICEVEVNAMTGEVVSKRRERPVMAPD